jgi:hypothetical protein
MAEATQTGAAEVDDDTRMGQLVESLEQPETETTETTETEGSPEAAPEQETETAPEEPEISTLDELAKSLNLEPDELLNLQYTVKVDGRDEPKPLRDIIKSFQLEGHVNNKSIELSNKLKEHETQRQQFQQQTQQEIQRLQMLGGYAQQMIHAKFQNIDWNALRATDPVEYAAKWTEFQQESQNLSAYLNQVQVLQQQQQAQAQQGQQAKLAEERQALVAKRPEWGNPQTFRKDYQAISDHLKSLGFADAEINGITDHRHLLIVDAAARYAALQQKKPEIQKQVRTAPRIAKPGARQQRDPKSEKLAALRKTAAANPRDEDAQAALMQHLLDANGV